MRLSFVLISAAAVAALSTSPALAARAKGGAGAMIQPPANPIPYSQLDAYLKASPKTRATKDWWAGMDANASTGATTGAAADTSATSRTMPGDTPSSAMPNGAQGAASGSMSGAMPGSASDPASLPPASTDTKPSSPVPDMTSPTTDEPKGDTSATASQPPR